MNMTDIQFTRLPTKLIYTLDSDLLKMLAVLIQQESYWKEHKKIGRDGSFYKPMKEFADCFRKKNLQDVRLILQTLQSEEFIEIISSNKGKQANYYRICWDKIASYNDKAIPQLIQSPMIRTAKRAGTKRIDDSTISYQQEEIDSTELYQQDRGLIVRDCTTTIDNIKNINNNITIDNTTLTKSPLYDAYKNRLDSLLADYATESDYIRALDKYNSIQQEIEYANKHIPTEEIEQYQSKLSELSYNHQLKGWNIQLDKITEDMIQTYHISNVFNVSTPKNLQQFTSTINNLLYNVDLHVSSDRWSNIAEDTEKWIDYQWENDVISYDHKQATIEKVYNKLAS
ncbi:hypothetical protein [Phocaeicola plebeius]|uniref:hypothetical protein n=1 Tax=Phocaeicola plebeius TaxID=310297 RepID=UPI0026E9819E|nr:hypothetical protein [Phocaeicola plebeius]